MNAHISIAGGRSDFEGAINGLNSAEDALSDPALVQEFKRREYVIVMMADEYASFRRHLHALSVKEQEIIIPLLKQEKDYYTLAEEAGVTSIIPSAPHHAGGMCAGFSFLFLGLPAP